MYSKFVTNELKFAVGRRRSGECLSETEMMNDLVCTLGARTVSADRMRAKLLAAETVLQKWHTSEISEPRLLYVKTLNPQEFHAFVVCEPNVEYATRVEKMTASLARHVRSYFDIVEETGFVCFYMLPNGTTQERWGLLIVNDESAVIFGVEMP